MHNDGNSYIISGGGSGSSSDSVGVRWYVVAGSGSCLDQTEVATTRAAVMAMVMSVVENMGVAV